MRSAPIILFYSALLQPFAHGQQTTARIVKYHANDIVNVHGKMSYTTLIQLPPAEKILNCRHRRQ